MRWRTLLGTLGFALLLVAAVDRAAVSQNKTIRIIVPYTPGSGPDILSRLMAEEIGNEHGPTMVVENRPRRRHRGRHRSGGACRSGRQHGAPGREFVRHQSGAQARQLRESTKDFAPVCYLAVDADGARGAGRLALQDTGGSDRRGEGPSPANRICQRRSGSSLHVAIEVLRRAANLNITYVPTAAPAPPSARCSAAMSCGLGGLSDRGVATSGRHAARPRHHLRHARVETLPDVPTFAETGVSNYEADIFYGYRRTGEDAGATRWRSCPKCSARALKAPDMKPKLAKQGLFPVGTLRGRVRRLHAKLWRRLRAHHSQRRTSRPTDIRHRTFLFLRLGGEEQRIAFALAEFGRFLGFGLGDVPGVDRDDAGAALVRGHHHAISLVRIHAEHRLEHLHHEFARRVIVVEQDHLVERRPLRLRSSPWCAV